MNTLLIEKEGNSNASSVTGNPDSINHIIQVESYDSCYEVLPDGRYVTDVPLMHPPPVESHSMLLVKVTCLTSCTQGAKLQIWVPTASACYTHVSYIGSFYGP